MDIIFQHQTLDIDNPPDILDLVVLEINIKFIDSTITMWCDDNLNYWCYCYSKKASMYKFFFEDEEDKVKFILKWI